jgi:hypothetical protein
MRPRQQHAARMGGQDDPFVPVSTPTQLPEDPAFPARAFIGSTRPTSRVLPPPADW